MLGYRIIAGSVLFPQNALMGYNKKKF